MLSYNGNAIAKDPLCRLYYLTVNAITAYIEEIATSIAAETIPIPQKLMKVLAA